MGKLEDKFIPIARSNVVQTPRDCASNDNTAEFYDPTDGSTSKEKAELNNGKILEMPNKTAEFHDYYIK